ncbi:hypothetical protein [Citrobacter portucalensis]|uniref:hypothetical protein n=1 Tax=Citrobacter portucalensis TaxID=1639133 RepID=UPI00186956F7|nr:hypothetical protein [Citrobacter freundii]EJD6668140.1 hypothetical protein [Citrobacter freundii]MBQ0205432.1 hypothetical protein [Citrobacter freundii]
MMEKIVSDLVEKHGIDSALADKIAADFLGMDFDKFQVEMSDLELAVLKSGGNLQELSVYLTERYPDIGAKAKGFIATRFFCKYASYEEINKSLKAGIKTGEWIYSGVVCGHSGLSSKKFKLSDGAFFKDGNIFPGREWDCRCSFKPVISFLDEEEETPPPKKGFFSRLFGG